MSTGLMQMGLLSAVVIVMELLVQQKERKLSYRPLMKASDNTELRSRPHKRNKEKLHGGSSTENLNKNHSENIRSPCTACLRVLCYSHNKQRLFP